MADSTTSMTTLRIPMLTIHNYEEWYATMQSMARMLMVSNALKPNSKPVNGKEREFWTLSHHMGISMGKDLAHLTCQHGKSDEWSYPCAIIARIERELRPHATAQRHALKHEFFTLTPTDGKPISKLIAKIDKAADKANKATKTAFPSILHAERLLAYNDIPWDSTKDQKDCEAIFAKMIELAPCFIDVKKCDAHTLEKYKKQSPTHMISLITDDDKLCKLLSSIATSHPIDFKFLAQWEDVTYEEAAEYLLWQTESPNASPSDSVRVISTPKSSQAKFCAYHQVSSHSSEECNAIKALNDERAKSAPRGRGRG